MPLPTLYHDTKEPKLLLNMMKKVAEDKKIPYEKRSLKTGDVGFNSALGKVLIERKKCNDLVNSLSGRGPSQFDRLTREADVPILLIEGRIGDWGGFADAVDERRTLHNTEDTYAPLSQWPFDSLDNMLLTWQMAGLYIVHSIDLLKTPYRIASIYNWCQRPDHTGGLRGAKLIRKV